MTLCPLWSLCPWDRQTIVSCPRLRLSADGYLAVGTAVMAEAAKGRALDQRPSERETCCRPPDSARPSGLRSTSAGTSLIRDATAIVRIDANRGTADVRSSSSIVDPDPELTLRAANYCIAKGSCAFVLAALRKLS